MVSGVNQTKRAAKNRPPIFKSGEIEDRNCQQRPRRFSEMQGIEPLRCKFDVAAGASHCSPQHRRRRTSSAGMAGKVYEREEDSGDSVKELAPYVILGERQYLRLRRRAGAALRFS